MNIHHTTVNQWRQDLLLALQHYWARNYAGAEAIFSKGLWQLPLLIADARQLKESAHSRSLFQTVRFMYVLSELGMWAISYQADPKQYQAHPLIANDLMEQDKLWRFVVDVYLQHQDARHQALGAYAAYLPLEGQGERSIRIARMLQQSPCNAQIAQVLQLIYGFYPTDESIGEHLCAYFLSQNQWEKAEQFASELHKCHPHNHFALESLAYITEQTSNWAALRHYYTLLHDHRRLALLALKTDDLKAIEQILEKAAQDANDDPFWTLCRGWIAFRQNHLADALAIWQKIPWTTITPADNISSAPVYLPEDALAVCQFLATVDISGSPPEVHPALIWLLHHSGRELGETDQLAEATRQLESVFNAASISDEGSQKPALGTVLPSSFALARVQEDPQQDQSRYLKLLPEALRRPVQAALLASKQQWFLALEALAPLALPQLRRRILHRSMTQAYQQQQWKQLGQALSYWREECAPGYGQYVQAVQDLVLSKLWQNYDVQAMQQELKRRIINQASGHTVPQPTPEWNEQVSTLYRNHHNAALVYSEHAQNGGNDETWKRAIGHWSVVLNNMRYWEEWCKERAILYGSTADQLTASDVHSQLIEEVISLWEKRVVASTDASLSSTYLRALFQWERQTVAALQHVLRAASRQNVALPAVVEQVGSPLLLKSYGLTDETTALLAALDRIKASPYEEQLLQKAFSETAEFEALMEVKAYDLALQHIRSVPASKRNSQQLGLAYQHLVEDMLSRSNFDEGLRQAEAFINELPKHTQTEALLARAATAWAESLLQNEKNTKQVVERLNSIRKQLSHLPPEFKRVLSFAYAEYGIERWKAEDTNNATAYLEQSLTFDENNPKAKGALAFIYHNQAMKKAEAAQLDEALQLARKAMNHEFDPATARLLLGIVTMLIMRRFENGQFKQGVDLIPSVFEYAEQCNDTEMYTNSIQSIMSTLVRLERYDMAITWLEQVEDTPYDEDILDVHDALSRLLTGTGMMAAEAGNYAEARRRWRLALEHNPDNTDARNALRRLGVR